MCGGSPRQSYKINTHFDALVHCSECQTSRAMEIKTIQPGMFGSVLHAANSASKFYDRYSRDT